MNKDKRVFNHDIIIFMMKPNLKNVSLGIILAIFSVFIAYHSINHPNLFGDTGLFYSTVHSIFYNNTSETYMFGSNARLLFTLDIPVMEPQEVCNKATKYFELSSNDKDFLLYHTNYFYYLLAPFQFFLTAPIIVHGTLSLTFVVLAYLIFLNFKNNGLPVFLSLILMMSFILHPGWSHTIFGQPFVDMYYLIFGFLICYFEDKKNTKLLLIIWILSLLINEKIMIMNSIFLIGIFLVNLIKKQKDKRHNIYILIMGLASLLLFIYATKFILTNPYYSSAVPNSIESLINYILSPRGSMGIFSIILVNIFLLLPIFLKDKLIFLLILALMSPNIFGNIGGAEKVNFFTHYHCLYIPFLFYYSSKFIGEYLGNLNNKKTPTLVLSVILFLFYSSIHFDNNLKPVFKNFSKNNNYYKEFFKNSYSYSEIKQDIEFNIPKESKVVAVEGALPFLYDYDEVYQYPMFMDEAEYMITYFNDDDKNNFQGYTSFISSEKEEETNECLYKKGQEFNFNYKNHIKINGTNLTIIKKLN